MKFEMNGIIYETGKRTIGVPGSIIPSAKKANGCSAVAAVTALGLGQGVIRGIGNAK